MNGQDKIKQIIVMRNDLQMRKGKMIAQGAHASMAFLTNELTLVPDGKDVPEYLRDTIPRYSITLSVEEQLWIDGIFTKICVQVNSEEELLSIHGKALASGLTSMLITDSGLTEFRGVATNTCCAIGPDLSSRIDPITKHLKLL